MSNANSKDKRFARHKCKECARYRIPDSGCPHYDSFLEYVGGKPLMDGNCAACSDFYPKCSADGESGKISQAGRMVSLTFEHAELFHDDSRNCYARVTHSEAASIHSIRSRGFKVWLSRLLWQATKKAPGSEALNSAVNVLESKALFEGEQYRLYNRVAPDPDGDGIWIDMCNDKWQAIHVTGEGWQIVDKPPILFRRYSHQQPLVTPVRGGDAKLFLKFVNLAEDNQDNEVLLIVEIIHFLVPGVPHVILVLKCSVSQETSASWFNSFRIIGVRFMTMSGLCPGGYQMSSAGLQLEEDSRSANSTPMTMMLFTISSVALV